MSPDTKSAWAQAIPLLVGAAVWVGAAAGVQLLGNVLGGDLLLVLGVLFAGAGAHRLLRSGDLVGAFPGWVSPWLGARREAAPEPAAEEPGDEACPVEAGVDVWTPPPPWAEKWVERG